MSDAPERIWLDWPAANRGDVVYDEPPERETQPGQTCYTRSDLCVTRADLDAAVALALEAAADCRKWFHYPIEMPVTAEGQGPATVGVDAAKITYEVWDELLRSHASFDNLPDAINEAMRLNAARALIQPHQANALARMRQEAHKKAIEVKSLVWFEVEKYRNGGKYTADGYTIRYIEGLYLLDFAGQSRSVWRFPALEAAQAAAQADYEARILAALETGAGDE